jgi:hypothetical protein
MKSKVFTENFREIGQVMNKWFDEHNCAHVTNIAIHNINDLVICVILYT